MIRSFHHPSQYFRFVRIVLEQPGLASAIGGKSLSPGVWDPDLDRP
jgi:hypothetical protein